ncbi:MAG: Hsp70 family protein, partial [Methylothermaceae bacterium]|nr:Hsp70 family protein [Methylothermaceae bacterium]
KSLEELGDKVPAAEKEPIESAIKDLEEAMKGDDKDAIEAKSRHLAELSGKLAQQMYGAAGGGEEAAGGAAGAGESASRPEGEEVVDAEFEEVKDDKK